MQARQGAAIKYIKLTFLGATQTVTGSKFLLDSGFTKKQPDLAKLFEPKFVAAYKK